MALVCRICLQHPKTETLLPTKPNFFMTLEQCTGVVLTENERMPNRICNSCALLVRAALKLRTMCQQAEKHLQKDKIKEEQEREPEHEQVEHEMQLDSDNELLSDDMDSYDVTLETGSTDGIIIKPSNSARPNRRTRITQVAEPRKPLAISYVCKICHNVYTEEAKLTMHLKQHNTHKPHECEICHKRFRQTPQLTRHMNSHTGLRPYKCKYCTASFADPSTRIKHQRIHTDERPYKCKFCNKSFAYSNVLNVHLRIHTGEKPFHCQHCGRPFSQAHHKNAHERTHKQKDELGIELTKVEEE